MLLTDMSSSGGLMLSLLIGAAFGFWGYRLAEKRGQSPWLWFAITFLLPIALLAFLFIGKTETDEGDRKPAGRNLTSWPGADSIDYRHAFKNTGIAVDKGNRRIYLKSTFLGVSKEKEYDFSDIREWSTNIQTGGQAVHFGSAGISPALGMAAHNIMINRRNEEQTGLFIQVRDIDFPEWRIAFPASKSREMDLKRWMEIMRQVVNET